MEYFTIREAEDALVCAQRVFEFYPYTKDEIENPLCKEALKTGSTLFESSSQNPGNCF
ncbi:hypothetical protein QBE54_10000 [Thermatribacter velox]|jgi:hypothetical protein|uniref:HEPN domain-containing protein n=1 Tax=Thermatribacter velox TaxID=3039681 RepID=A0ABZ2YA59_9BACT